MVHELRRERRLRKQVLSLALGIAVGLSSWWAYSSITSSGVEVRFVPSKQGATSGELIANLDGRWTRISTVGGQVMPAQ